MDVDGGAAFDRERVVSASVSLCLRLSLPLAVSGFFFLPIPSPFL